MIFQGVFNILSFYLNELEIFYDKIDKYFMEKISSELSNKNIGNLNNEQILERMLKIITNKLISLGFDSLELENKMADPFFEMSSEESSLNIKELYDKKVAPIVYEIFLEKIVDYLVDVKSIPIMLNLKSKGFFELGFIIELRNLKNLMDKFPEKKENLNHYINLSAKIIDKLSENKKDIETLEDLNEPQDKLQLIYLIYRIISFFHLEKRFDFSHIKEYLPNNMKDWLTSIPLVTLKNPDLYYCGLFLAKNLNINLESDTVKEYLQELYEEGTDEFEAPLVEATDGLYYYLKSTQDMGLWLKRNQITRLVETGDQYFDPSYLKNLETSQLVVILKIYNLLGLREEEHVNAILEEIETRVTPEGIFQYRDGFLSSEATYYVIFLNYMRTTLEKLKDFNLLESITSRIYRNLEILDFSAVMNFDLLSELFYSLESLKLFNCIETKEMIIHLAKFLFPQEVVNSVTSSKELITSKKARFRHLKVNKITGETIY